jgi:toxin ParE1/3/4
MRVRWTRPAQTDFLEILSYIACDDAAVAERVGERLLSAVDALATQPRRGRPGRVAGTRELVVSKLPYVVIYRIVEVPRSTARELEVLRVIHGARRWPIDGG